VSDPQNSSSRSGLGEQRSGSETQMDCDAILDLAPGFVLDALDPDETKRVGAHIGACAACAAHTAELERTVGLLPYLSPRATPPPDVKAALFTRIAQAQARPADQIAAVTVSRPSVIHAIPERTSTIPAFRPSPTVSAPAAASAPRKRRGLFGLRTERMARASWRSYSLPVATTAIPLVLALALVGGWAYSLYDDASSARDDQSFMGTFSSVLSGGEGNLFDLTSTAAAKGAEGQFLASLDGNDGILMVSGLQPEQADQTYEVWIEQDGKMYRYSTLDVDSQGNGQLLIEVDGTFKRCRGVYIQLAPVDGNAGSRSDVLWTTLMTPGPANGDNLTEGDPEIGTTTVATVPLSSK
jgi:Anti-sigma-K factor rskA/Putative zinc-finger